MFLPLGGGWVGNNAMKKTFLWLGLFALLGAAITLWFVRHRGPNPIDDAKAAGKTVADFQRQPRGRSTPWTTACH